MLIAETIIAPSNTKFICLEVKFDYIFLPTLVNHIYTIHLNIVLLKYLISERETMTILNFLLPAAEKLPLSKPFSHQTDIAPLLKSLE